MKKTFISKIVDLFRRGEEKDEGKDEGKDVGQVERLDDALSTKVTDEDLAGAVKDESGVLYSRDGKRLLKTENRYFKTYRVREGTKVICDKAFEECRKLTEVELPTGLAIIGYKAFCDCWDLVDINFPEGLVSIDFAAFNYCMGLRSLIFPKSLRSIGSSAFYHCWKVTRIDFPKNLKSIDSTAFSQCDGLTDVELPEGLQEIGDNPFEGCDNIRISSRSPLFRMENNLLLRGDEVVGVNGNVSHIILPDHVTSIAPCTFMYSHNLNEVESAGRLTSVGDSAFCDCWDLTRVRFSGNLTSIGTNTFFRCTKLIELEVPETVCTIGEQAFSQCIALRRFTVLCFPDSDPEAVEIRFRLMLPEELYDKVVAVPMVERNAPTGCAYDSDSGKSEVEAGSAAVYSGDGKALLRCGKRVQGLYRVKEGTEVICERAFESCIGLIKVVCPDSLKYIEDKAFVGCMGLEEIELPENLYSIVGDPFENCECFKSMIVNCSSASGFESALRRFSFVESLTNRPAVFAQVNSEIGQWRDRANAGDAAAQNFMGNCYRVGKGVERKSEEAARWYALAAAQGDCEGLCRLGAAYFNGEGAAQDKPEGARLYAKGAEKGDPRCRYLLGLCLLNGDGVRNDADKGLGLIRDAAGQGYAPAGELLDLLKAKESSGLDKGGGINLSRPLSEIVLYNVRFRDCLREFGVETLVDRIAVEATDLGHGKTEFRKKLRRWWNRDMDKRIADYDIQSYGIGERFTVLGHTFNGYDDVKSHCELTTHGYFDGRFYAHRPAYCIGTYDDIHVGEVYSPYPVFDSSDLKYEDRCYENYIFRRNPITEWDLKVIFRLEDGECKINETIPEDLLPILYRNGDSPRVLLAASKSAPAK